MRLISWNCQGGFRNKAEHIFSLKPDILCIQEMEAPEKINFNQLAFAPHTIHWHGETKNKGVGTLIFNPQIKASLLRNVSYSYRIIQPLEISISRKKFSLFNVWTKSNNQSLNYPCYIDYANSAIQHYHPSEGDKSIWIGDFNANKFLSSGKRFEKFVDLCTARNMQSVYHYQNQCLFGKESEATLFVHRNIEKPYHVDFAFCHNSLLKKVRCFSYGEPENWLRYSDHIPLILDFKNFYVDFFLNFKAACAAARRAIGTR